MKKKLAIGLTLAVVFSMLLGAVAMAESSEPPAPYIVSDKADYAPGESVALNGGNWQAGEVVQIFVNDNIGASWQYSANVRVGDTGTLSTTFNLPNWFVAQYLVIATGETSGTATTIFTDSVIKTVTTVARTSGNDPSALGELITFTATITKQGSGDPITYGQVEFRDSTAVPDGDHCNPSTPLLQAGIDVDSNGQVQYSTSSLPSGYYLIVACYLGTGGTGTQLSWDRITHSVGGDDPTVTELVSGSGTYAGSGSLTATLTSGGVGLGSRTLSFTLGGVPVGTAITDGTGLASLAVSVSGWDAGTHVGAVGASFAGETGYGTSSGSGPLVVSPAPVTMTAGSYTGAFDGVAHATSACTVTGTYTGALTCTNSPLTVGPSIGSGSVAPNLALNGELAGNFTVTPAAGSWSITTGSVTITAGSYSGAYDGASHSPTACVVSGTYKGDLTCTNDPTSVKDAGSGTITPALVLNGEDADNFDVNKVNGSWSIAAAHVTLQAGSYSGTYDGNTHSPTACVVSGVFTGPLTCTNDPSVLKKAGSGEVAPVLDLHDELASNFDVSEVDGSWSIAKAPVTMTAGSYSGTYDGASHSPTACVVSGTYKGALTCTNDPSSVKDAGSGSVTPKIVLNGEDDENYIVTPKSGSWSIMSAPVTMTAGGYSGIYDGVAHAPSDCSVTGTYKGALTCTNNPTSVKNVGSGTVVPVLELNGEIASNFAVTSANGSWSVTAAPVTIAAGSYSGTFDGVAHVPSACTVTGTYTGALNCTNNPALVGPGVGAGSVAPVLVLNGEIAGNFAVTSVNGSWTILKREGQVAYIGQTVFVTSGSSSTTAQVALSASVADPDGSHPVFGTFVTFTDLLSDPHKVLASNVPVSVIDNTQPGLGTANTIVTLSTGKYGSAQYLIEVTLTGNYKNEQQTLAAPGTDPYEAAHPVVVVMIPPTKNTMQAKADISKLTTAAGKYGDAAAASYNIGMIWNNKGTNPQGQVELILYRADGTYYIKSNSITSLAYAGTGKDVTIYTKASIYRIGSGGTVSVDGNVTLRVDAHDGGTSGDTIGFTVLSSKDGSLYYSNNWMYNSKTKAWGTVQQGVTPGTAVIIN